MKYMLLIDFEQVAFILRLVIASVCGACIGWERKNRSKEAGVRTHCIVACGSALMMIISKYGFIDINSFDGSRVAAQIVSGIGFLGAGMIFVHKNTITGLTTAAGVWATAGIGMALGAGMYVLGISSTIIILIIQIVLHKNSKFIGSSKMMLLSLHSDGETGFQKKLLENLESMKIHVYSVDVSNDVERNRFNYLLTVELPEDLTEEEIVSQYEGSRITPCH